MTLTEAEESMVALVRDFIDQRVVGNVREFDEDDVYPEEFIEEMKKLVLWHLDVEGQKPADIAPLLGMRDRKSVV